MRSVVAVAVLVATGVLLGDAFGPTDPVGALPPRALPVAARPIAARPVAAAADVGCPPDRRCTTSSDTTVRVADVVVATFPDARGISSVVTQDAATGQVYAVVVLAILNYRPRPASATDTRGGVLTITAVTNAARSDAEASWAPAGVGVSGGDATVVAWSSVPSWGVVRIAATPADADGARLAIPTRSLAELTAATVRILPRYRG